MAKSRSYLIVSIITGVAGVGSASSGVFARSSPQADFRFDIVTYASVTPEAGALELKWRTRPSDKEAAKRLPRYLQRGSSVNIRCVGLRAGTASGCSVIEAAPNDEKLKAAALSFVSALRDPDPIPESEIKEIDISFHFRDPSAPEADHYCLAPFCQAGSVPPAPSPPAVPKPD